MKLSTKLAAVLPATALAVSCATVVPAAAATQEPQPAQVSASSEGDNLYGVALINDMRGQHAETAPVKYDSHLAIEAEQMTRYCQGDPSVPLGGVFRMVAGAPTADMAAKKAVEEWYGERAFYDYATGGSVNGSSKAFTQLVWKGSTHAGVWVKQCPPLGDVTHYAVGAMFSPEGNTAGGSKENVGVPLSALPVKPFNICNWTNLWLTLTSTEPGPGPENRTLRSGDMIDRSAPCNNAPQFHSVEAGLNHTATYKYDVSDFGSEDPTNPVRKVGELTITMKWDMDGNPSYTFTKSEGHLSNLKVLQRGSDLIVEY